MTHCIQTRHSHNCFSHHEFWSELPSMCWVQCELNWTEDCSCAVGRNLLVYLRFIKLKKHWRTDITKTFCFVTIHPWLEVISVVFVPPLGNISTAALYNDRRHFVHSLSIELQGLGWCLWASPQLAMFPAWLILTIRNNRIFEIALSIQMWMCIWAFTELVPG